MSRVAITLDLDWAPDFMIEAAAQALLDREVKATWFVTHDSPAVRELAEHPELFELGIHPNFLDGSSHGATPAEVVAHCAALVPGARSVRTHCLLQSTPLHDALLEGSEVDIDVSLFLPGATGLEPVEQWSPGGRLLRLPYVWQDNMEMYSPTPNWDAAAVVDAPGLRIFDFHPVHVWLNSASFAPYERLKASKPLGEVTEMDAWRHRNSGPGAMTAFLELADRLAREGGGARIGDLA
jgi:peptidoglycan/xylan/chitin deacetylase (PgdA/CDA1 family)